MSSVKVISLSRAQLARFIPDFESIKQFESLFSQNNDVIIVMNNIIDSSGFTADGVYSPRTNTNHLDLSTNLYQDGTILDEFILELITNISSDSILTSEAQTVLVDASLGDVNLTLPPPSAFFNATQSRSFRMAIHKVDSSSNVVNILPNSGEMVINEASQSLLYEGEILNLITNGTNWYLGA